MGAKGEGSGWRGGGKWGLGTPCPPLLISKMEEETHVGDMQIFYSISEMHIGLWI